ncbi:TPA: hypothetical protein H1008_00145 [archaeon]|nr:hypothetical protein [Candidatus Undinarchaeales archaeon SRR5007147.bin71]
MGFKKFFVIIGIGLIFTIFFAYGMDVFYESPDHDCWDLLDKNETRDSYFNPNNDPNYRACEEIYDIESEKHARVGFIALGTIATLAIAAGILLTSLDAVGSGLLSGGIFLFIYTTLRYWGFLNKYLRLSLIGFALAALLYFGYTKIDKTAKQ